MGIKKFILFENVKIVNGSKNSGVIDLQRESVYQLPISIEAFVRVCLGKSIKEIYKYYSGEIDIAKNYLKFLLKHELCCFVENAERFPKLSEYWNSPFEITNGILDIDEKLDVPSIIKAMSDIIIPYLSLRVYKIHEIDYIKELIFMLDEKIHVGYTIYLPYNKLINDDVVKLVLNSTKCYSLIFYNAPSTNRIESSIINKDISITSEKISSHLDCGKINDYINPNIKTFMESLQFNSCLNRKIAIDVNGDIKNCPSMPETFGNIRDTTLKEALEKRGFKKYWTINKDKIHVCKDCEFRYICTDCRAYIEAPEDILSKPLKCGYNPYTGEWSEWSTNPIKQKAIKYYEMEGLVAGRLVRLKNDVHLGKDHSLV